MDTDKFDQKIEQAKRQLEDLQVGEGGAPGGKIVIEPGVAQGLMNALEELHVIEEELRQRNQELAQARQALALEKRRYQGMFEFGPNGCLVTNLGAVIREANQAAGDLLGVPPDFLEGRPLAAYVCQADKKAFRDQIDLLPEVGQVDEWELCLRPRHGDLTPVLASVTVMPPDAEEPGELCWILHDISARVRAEQNLQENLEQYQQFFDSNPEYCYFISPQGKVIDINRSALETLGYRKDEIVGKPVETIYAPEYVSRVRDLFSRWLQTGQLIDEEMVIITKGGERKTVLLSATTVYIDGHKDHSISIQKDITERVETHRQLTEKNIFIETILDNLPIGLAVNFIDKGTADYFNPRFEEIYGWPAEKMRDIPTFFELVYPDPKYREEVRGMVMADIESGDPDRMAWEGIEITTSQGEKRIIAAKNIPLYDQNLMISTVRDITERVRAKKEIESTKAFLDTVIDRSPFAMWISDEAGTALRTNRSLRRVLGLSDDEIIGKYNVFKDENLEAAGLMPKVRAVFDRYKAVRFNLPWKPTLVRDVDFGTAPERFLDVSMFPIVDSGGELTNVVCQWVDITERIQAEEEIKQRNRELATLLEVGQQLTSKLELDDLLDAIARATVAALPSAEAASLWLYDEEKAEMVVRSWLGFDDDFMSGRRLPVDDSLAGRIFRNRRAYIIDDAVESGDFEHLVHPKLKLVRSVVGAPVLIENQAVGALFADNFSRTAAFDEHELRILRTLGHQAAIALNNALAQQSLQQRSEELRTLAIRLAETEETERRRLARELHDQVGQSLAVLNFNLNRAQAEIEAGDSEECSRAIKESLSLVTEISGDIRDVMDDLRPAVLDDYGLFAALNWFGDRFEGRTGIDVRIEGRDTQPRLASRVETALFRITQEALANVARHAQADEVILRLDKRGDRICLEIEDDGVGFAPEGLAPSQQERSWGLINMRERAEAVGGSFTIESSLGEGTKISVEVGRRQA